MRRFERIYDVVEPVEEYRHGGYHPVHLHDIFNQRYEVVAKLAFGQFSTVWVAYDLLLQRQVALKILKAEASKDGRELSMLASLSASGLDHPGKRHVVTLLDYFNHDGPNGTHLCLVLPVMISDGEAMTVNGKPHQVGYVQAISKQVLLGLDFLHTLGIVHCDLQLANIMFSVLGAIHGEMPLQAPKFSAVRWLDRTKPDNSAPKYLVISQRRRGQLDDVDPSSLLVKIGDLGGAMWSQERDQWPVTPTALREPELINRNKWDSTIDIWTLGCLIFELATNEPLFPLGSFGLTSKQVDEEHHHLISQLLDKNSQLQENLIDRLTDRLPSDFGVGSIRQLASFLSLMIQRNPQTRMPANKLLKHTFLV